MVESERMQNFVLEGRDIKGRDGERKDEGEGCILKRGSRQGDREGRGRKGGRRGETRQEENRAGIL